MESLTPNETQELPTNSPINKKKLGGQNKRLYDYLLSGKSIHCMHPDKIKLKIGYLNSRCSDLINKFKIPITKKYITVEDTTVVEYSLSKI